MTKAETAAWADGVATELDAIYHDNEADEILRTLAFEASLEMSRLHVWCRYPNNTTATVTSNGVMITLTAEVEDD